MCCLLLRRSPGSRLFPYTTLFRSRGEGGRRDRLGARALARPVPPRQRRAVAAVPRGERGDGSDQEALHPRDHLQDRKSTRLNSSHGYISYAVFCLKKKTVVQISTC